MLNNVESADVLSSLARTKSRAYINKTINPLLLEQEVEHGWKVDKKNKNSIRLVKNKDISVLLEDRVWFLLYRMGFSHLSGKGGGKLVVMDKDKNSPITQIDIVGIDTETALAIECKSAQKRSKRPQFQEELGKHALSRQPFANSVNQQFPTSFKRQAALVMFTHNIILSENDRKRAQEANVVLFDEQDLTYYEELVSHLGPAAKYQFLADLFPGKNVPGLALTVPAIRTKMGGYTCYTFSISPEYLLKISYVSHRAKGKASDVNTYQRMIQKSRLRKIREYIDNDGIFPTNIVINFDGKPQFERREQEGSLSNTLLGWLRIKPTYKSAWIIDGQHRLFAYSGSQYAAKSSLSVLAFEGLNASTQAELFIDINAEQKSVKQSLLQELYAELHWDAEDPAIRMRAVISKTVQSLDEDPESPFYQRILTADEKKDARRCVSLQSLFKALDNSDLYILSSKKGSVIEYGPLWAVDNQETQKRTVCVLNHWFSTIRTAVPDWWETGSGEGGGISMNDSITSQINILRSVYSHLSLSGNRLLKFSNKELCQQVEVYVQAIGAYLSGLSPDERQQFRDLRGVQGQTTRTRRCQQAIHLQIPSFAPSGLKEFIELEKTQTNAKAKIFVDRIESTLQRTIVQELKQEFQSDDSQWWIEGIPKGIRLKVSQRQEEDDNKRGEREFYFDLLDYRNIILNNWTLFDDLLGYGKTNMSKDKRTAWINDVNEIRKIVSHASTGKAVSLEQLAQIESTDTWLSKQLSAEESEHL